MRSIINKLVLLSFFWSAALHASEEQLRKVIAVQQAQLAKMKAEFEAYKNKTDGLASTVDSIKKGNRSSCYEVVLNPGYYSNSPNLAVINPLPEGSTIEGNNQVGPLTKLMCKSGYFLSGVRVWNFDKMLDRAYCCSL